MRLRPPRTTNAVVLLLLLAGPLVAGCSSDASTRAEASGAAEAAPVAAVPTSIPPGVTLRVGDQLDAFKSALKLAGEDQDFPYEVEYASFVGGPPMLQAFQAGAIDTGILGSTPLIFAQAANQDIRAVAGWAGEGASYKLTVSGTSGIAGWGDLAGKKVAFQKGTAAEAAVLQALDRAGVAFGDITPVDLPITQVAQALQGGAADAALLVEPLLSVYRASNPTAEVVAEAREITDRSAFVVARQATLDDPGKSAALGDFIARLVRAYAYQAAHPDEVAQSTYVEQYHLPLDRAKAIVAERGATSFVALPGPVLKAQQRLADLFLSVGTIPVELDVSRQFDTRYNDIVARAAEG